MRTSRPWPAQLRARNVLISASTALLIAFLIAFHAFLLWQRVLDLSLFKLGPAMRWLATIALMVGLYRLHRQGVSLVNGRSALVFWLLVLLLHVSFWGPLAESSSAWDGWAGTELLLALPAITIVLGILFPSIWKWLARASAPVGSRGRPDAGFIRDSQSYTTRAGVLPVLACRPPPALSQ